MKVTHPRSETVTCGRDTIGTIIINDRGAEAFAPDGKYVCTFARVEQARKALFERHQANAQGGAE
jgi:hypothetical protein